MKIKIEGSTNLLRIIPATNPAGEKPFAFDLFNTPDITAQGNKLVIVTATRRREILISADVIDSINGQSYATIVQSETDLNTINEAVMNNIVDILTQQP